MFIEDLFVVDFFVFPKVTAAAMAGNQANIKVRCECDALIIKQ